MRRRLVGGALVVVVPVAALLGLFVHAHPDDHGTEHHEARAIHAHFGGHVIAERHAGPHGPVVDDGDDDHDRALYFGSYVGEATPPSVVAAVVPHSGAAPAPAVRNAQPPVHVVHGHDPPALGFRPTRAPPRLPVLI